MKARFSSMVPNASSEAARRMYGDFGAPLPLLVVVVVSDIDSLTKHPSVICRKISGVGWIGRGGRTAGEQPESEAVQVTLLHGFLSGHLHGSDGVVALVLVGVEIDEPAGALCAGGLLFHDFDAHGGARELVPMIVDVLPGLIVHLEGAHFGSSPRDRIAHFEGAGAGGKFATFSGQYLNKLKVPPGPIASPCTKRRRPDRCCPSPRRLPSTAGHAGRRLHGRRTRPEPYRRASPQQRECSSTDGHSNARIRLEPLNRVPKTFGKRWATTGE